MVKQHLRWWLVLCTSLMLSAPAMSQWSTNSVIPMNIRNSNVHQSAPRVISDGNNGVLMIWAEGGGGFFSYNFALYAQHLNEYGEKMWGEDGVLLDDYGVLNPNIVSDGNGGAFITWDDADNDPYAVRLQHIGPGGQLMFSPEGDSIGSGLYPKMLADNHGGVILSWESNENAYTVSKIHAQRISHIGEKLWSDTSVVVTSTDVIQTWKMSADTSGGAHFIWQEGTSSDGYSILLQHLDSGGSLVWGESGMPLGSTDDSSVSEFSIIAGKDNSALVAYNNEATYRKLILCRLDGQTGSNIWTTYVTADTNTYQTGIKMISDNLGGAVLVWREMETGGEYSLYTQKMTANGGRIWSGRGVPIITYSDLYLANHNLLITNDGNPVVAFSHGEGNITAQKIGTTGYREWSYSGERIYQTDNSLYGVNSCLTSDGNLITTWNDLHTGISQVYAQLMDHYGFLGNGHPRLLSVLDVPDDQGGQVTLRWKGSVFDTPETGYINHYSVWRGVANVPESKQQTGVTTGNSVNDAEHYRAVVTSDDTIYWEWIADMPAHEIDHYSYTASTLADSSANGTSAINYMVSAEMNNYEMLAHWDSHPMSGYSVDNLAPAPPVQLVAHLNNAAVQLQWKQNSEDDLGQYAIYRSTQADFDPDTATVYQTITDTTFQDVELGTASELHYVVEALDIHGNHSDASNRASVTVTGTQTEDGALPKQFALQQNYPNPFNPTTTIRYALPEKSVVTLTVYNARGEVVRTLVQESQSAGFHSAEFEANTLPSGMYFYRIQAKGFNQTRRMILLK